MFSKARGAEFGRSLECLHLIFLYKIMQLVRNWSSKTCRKIEIPTPKHSKHATHKFSNNSMTQNKI